MMSYRMTAARKIALKKAQLASARKRRKLGKLRSQHRSVFNAARKRNHAIIKKHGKVVNGRTVLHTRAMVSLLKGNRRTKAKLDSIQAKIDRLTV